MKGNSKHIIIDKEVIELYDIVESDFKIEEGYKYANEILFEEKSIEKKLPFRKQNQIERMRITTLNSR
jgi:hypothetical protein